MGSFDVSALLSLARSDHPRADDACSLLSWVMEANGGPLAQRARQFSLEQTRQGTNPFTRREWEPNTVAPTENDLEDERRWLRALKERIEAETPTWLGQAAKRPSGAHGVLHLLASIARYSGSVEAESAVRAAAAAAGADERRDLLRLLEELDSQR